MLPGHVVRRGRFGDLRSRSLPVTKIEQSRVLDPRRVYNVDLGHPVGHEPAFVRPAIVVSADVLNNSAGDLVVVSRRVRRAWTRSTPSIKPCASSSTSDRTA